MTASPGLNMISVTRPPTSGVTVTSCTASSEPMPVAERGTIAVVALTAATCAGGGLLLAKKFLIAWSRNRLKP